MGQGVRQVRSIIKTYVYECDAIPGPSPVMACDETQEVTVGDAIPKYQGALFPHVAGKVASVDDADRVMRLRYGWSVGHAHLCPEHRE
jgi:hypothetical protein